MCLACWEGDYVKWSKYLLCYWMLVRPLSLYSIYVLVYVAVGMCTVNSGAANAFWLYNAAKAIFYFCYTSGRNWLYLQSSALHDVSECVKSASARRQILHLIPVILVATCIRSQLDPVQFECPKKKPPSAIFWPGRYLLCLSCTFKHFSDLVVS